MTKIKFDAFNNLNFYCEQYQYHLGNALIWAKWNEIFLKEYSGCNFR